MQDEKLLRPAVLPGALVAIIAMVGVDCAVSAAQPVERVWKGPSIVARVVVPANANHAALVSVTGLSLCSIALVALLLLGRQSAFVAYRLLRPLATQPQGSPLPALRLRARMSISYYTGGLYGP